MRKRKSKYPQIPTGEGFKGAANEIRDNNDGTGFLQMPGTFPTKIVVNSGFLASGRPANKPARPQARKKKKK